MSKVQDFSVLKNTVTEKEKGQLLGLSNCPNLTAKIFVQRFWNGECLVRIVPDIRHNSNSKPPMRSGELIQENGLTPKAASKIKRMSRMMQHLVLTDRNRKAYCSFLTLTYPKHYPDDKTAKKHLDNFFKRMRRAIPEFMYLWVAEKQKRGAIHFHILTPDYVPMKLLNKHWSEIVAKWYKANGYEFDMVLPNVKAVHNAGSYLAKYITKEGNKIHGNLYGISQNARKLSEPTLQMNYEVPADIANDVLQDALYNQKGEVFTFTGKDFAGNTTAWLTDSHQLMFNLKEITECL